jgi:hypothetical protein
VFDKRHCHHLRSGRELLLFNGRHTTGNRQMMMTPEAPAPAALA